MFCKKCGQKVEDKPTDFILGKKYVELEDGFYCIECAKIEIRKRREKK
jgi:hypothetical protein